MKRWLLIVLLFTVAWIARPSWAAVTPNSVITAQIPKHGMVQFTPSTSASNYYTAFTAGANGSKIVAMWLDTNDTATHVVTCQVVCGASDTTGCTSATKYGSLTITTTAGAGSQAYATTQDLITPAVWPGLPKDTEGNPYMFLNNSDTIQCTYLTPINTSDQVDIHVIGADF